MKWIDPQDKELPLARQCVLTGVSKATVYRHRETQQRQEQAQQENNELRSLIDAQYTAHPFYGSRRMVEYLKTKGHGINRKRVQRLMRQMGLAGMAPGPSTSTAHPQHKVYPYLLRGVEVSRPNR
jgi:putative transposase